MSKKKQNTQKKTDLDAANCQQFERELLDPATSKERLEAICMTLAHTDNREAQDALLHFKQSDRAHEVAWLDCAIEEGRFYYLEPRNKKEERDYLSLKMVQEMTDQLVQLQIELDEARLNLRRWSIEEAAVSMLVKKGDFEELEIDCSHDARILLESRVEKLEQDFSRRKKIIDCIHESISTLRYREVDLEVMRSIHFT